jgi:hypothetical protein
MAATVNAITKWSVNCGYPWTPQVERAIGVLDHLVKKLASA